MEITLSVVREFLAAQKTKDELRPQWVAARIGQEGYDELRAAFRTADDTTEDLLPQVIDGLRQAQVDDVTDELLDALSEDERTRLHKVFSERGLLELLEASTNDLAGAIKKYRKASALSTAARELNMRRRQLPYGEFVDGLSFPPAGVDEDAWRQVVEMLGAEEEIVDEENADNTDVDLEDVTSEAAYRIERRLRARNDAADERLVALLSDVVQNGTFDRVIADLDPDLRRVAREFQSHVPMPQLQPQPKPDPRPVAVIDDVATDEAVLSEEEQAVVADLLKDLGWN